VEVYDTNLFLTPNTPVMANTTNCKYTLMSPPYFEHVAPMQRGRQHSTHLLFA